MRVINLLPKIRQQELKYESVFRSLKTAFALSIVSFGLVFLAQVSAKLYLQIQAQSIKGQIAQLKDQVNKQQNTDVKSQVTAINNLISDYNNLAAASPKWSQVIQAFAPLPPPGVHLNSFIIDPSDNSITITGVAATRDQVIQLYNNILADTANFNNINYPLENVVDATDVNFHFTFFIQPQLLK